MKKIIFVICLSLITNIAAPTQARAEFSTTIFAAGIIVGIMIEKFSNYYDGDKESEKADS
jgi:hypothetical protein